MMVFPGKANIFPKRPDISESNLPEGVKWVLDPVGMAGKKVTEALNKAIRAEDTEEED
ncbi:MAG: hypothetical protein IJS39_09150 [Synergistaceae bacterium]|nr:hypothetical protein [Synergistaceae bacterium]